jgi:tetratricopeptide (TPR) repeat protein
VAIPAGRARVFRFCLVVLVPLLFCLLLEAGLRLGGYGYPTHFFLGPDASGACETNARFGWRFFPRALAKGPDPHILPAKPAGAVRIFVLGSSAAMGIPDASFSFGRILAVMLRQQYPGVQFEVVNGAITAINSHVALEIARDCAAHKPDLFFIYMGNNEVVGPYGPGTVFQKWSPSLGMIRAGIWAKATRAGQLLTEIAGAFHRTKDAPSRWLGMEMFLNNPVAADDPRLPAVYDNYRRNLADICGVARGAGAGVVLSTVAVNLRDCPPLASQHRANLTGAELAEWESIYKAAGSLEASNRWQEAVAQYEAAAKIDDRFAELHYRLGQSLLKTGRFVEARGCFELARDLDVLRFRADSHINPMIREVAAAQKAAGVRFVDAEQALAEDDPDSHGIPGEDLFYEHVHFTFNGNYLLARAVLGQVCESLPQLAGLRRQGEIPSRQQCAEWLALTSWEEYRLAEEMFNMTARPPFTNQLDHKLRQEAARQRRDDLHKAALTLEALRADMKTYQAALAKAPADGSLNRLIGRWAIKCGLPKVALAHLQVAVRTRPGDVWVQCDYGNALAGVGRVEEAMAEYRKALKIKPDLEIAYNNLGLALAGQGKWDEAIARYRKAVEIKPDYADAHFNLALALAQTGNLPEAIEHLRKTLEIKPDDAEAHFKLAVALAQTGNLPEAITHFRRTVDIKPDELAAHYNLAMALAQTGKLPEAIEHYEQAVRIKPDGAQIHCNLAAALQQAGRLPEAIGHYTEAVRLKPDFLLALNSLAWIRATSSDPQLRDGAEATRLAERACQLTGRRQCPPLDALAAAYAEAGRFAEAVTTAEEAITSAKAAGQQESAMKIQARLDLYRAGKPYHETPRTMSSAGQ